MTNNGQQEGPVEQLLDCEVNLLHVLKRMEPPGDA